MAHHALRQSANPKLLLRHMLLLVAGEHVVYVVARGVGVEEGGGDEHGTWS